MSALFPSKSAHHSEDFFKTDDFKTTRQKEPGYMLGSLSMKNQGDFKKKRPSSSLCQTARGSGATSKWEYLFLQKRYTSHKDLMKRYTVLLKKALGRHLFLLDET